MAINCSFSTYGILKNAIYIDQTYISQTHGSRRWLTTVLYLIVCLLLKTLPCFGEYTSIRCAWGALVTSDLPRKGLALFDFCLGISPCGSFAILYALQSSILHHQSINHSIHPRSESSPFHQSTSHHRPQPLQPYLLNRKHPERQNSQYPFTRFQNKLLKWQHSNSRTLTDNPIQSPVAETVQTSSWRTSTGSKIKKQYVLLSPSPLLPLSPSQLLVAKPRAIHSLHCHPCLCQEKRRRIKRNFLQSLRFFFSKFCHSLTDGIHRQPRWTRVRCDSMGTYATSWSNSMITFLSSSLLSLYKLVFFKLTPVIL